MANTPVRAPARCCVTPDRPIERRSGARAEFAFLPTAEKAALPGELDRRIAAFESGLALAFQRLLPDTSGAFRNTSR